MPNSTINVLFTVAQRIAIAKLFSELPATEARLEKPTHHIRNPDHADFEHLGVEIAYLKTGY
jgi:hypothetical protein